MQKEFSEDDKDSGNVKSLRAKNRHPDVHENNAMK